MSFEIGDHVRDKFKSPKPGDMCTTGSIAEVGIGDTYFVDWDDGRRTCMPAYLLEKEETCSPKD